jgi:iron-sulfur cluster repair protein YtfE (RIC family)
MTTPSELEEKHETQKRQGITSTVILDPQDWADMSFLIPHEAIRTMQNNMDVALKLIKPQKTDVWKLKRWFQYYEDVFYVFIHHHHTTEDELVLPVILDKSGQDLKNLSDDHHKLVGALKQIENAGKEFKRNHANLGEQDIIELHKMLSTEFSDLKAKMEEHLAEEERIFPVFLRTHYSEAETKILEEKIIRAIGDHMKNLWGAVSESIRVWATPEQLEYFLNGIPWVPRQLAYHIWQPHYRWIMQNTLESITAGHDEEPPLVASKECVIL